MENLPTAPVPYAVIEYDSVLHSATLSPTISKKSFASMWYVSVWCVVFLLSGSTLESVPTSVPEIAEQSSV